MHARESQKQESVSPTQADLAGRSGPEVRLGFGSVIPMSAGFLELPVLTSQATLGTQKMTCPEGQPCMCREPCFPCVG